MQDLVMPLLFDLFEENAMCSPMQETEAGRGRGSLESFQD